MNTMSTLAARLVLSLAILGFASASAAGQAPSPPAQPQPDDPMLRVGLPTVTVTAQKEPEDIQKLPVSVSAATKEIIDRAGIRIVSDAALLSPNTSFTEFTARKLSNARIRGIGSSPNNPAITTFIDGVPQLNANSSSLDLLDVQQIEFVRGPQSALFGRNTLGGLVNVASVKPAFTKWTGNFSVPFGNYSAFEVRGNASGMLVADTLSASGAFSYASRDGYTINDVTGDDLDSRSAITGKAQLLWKPAAKWEARVIVTAESAEDGDYGLNDLETLRQNPYHSSRDFEGFTDRNVFNTTILTEYKSDLFTVSTTTGFVRWTTDDATDLDYSPQPLVTRRNEEEDFQFTQEVRFAPTYPVGMDRLKDKATLGWQAGVFLFTQSYHQDAVNTIAPFVFSPLVNVPVDQVLTRRRARRLRRRRLRAGHAVAHGPARCDRRRAVRLRNEGRRSEDVLRSAARAADGRRGGRQLRDLFSAGDGGVPVPPGQHGVRNRLARLQGGRLQSGVPGRQ